jgi:hypothetical protein
MRNALFTITVALAACGGTTADDTGDDVPDGVVDVRVPIPDPDPAYLDLVTPEVVIEAGQEKMYCYYLNNADAELAVSTLEALQGRYGHHIVLLTTVEPEPDGTFEDCSDRSEMWKFRSFVLPVPLPGGHAVRVPMGLQYVMQIHYVNAGDEPILVRDVARLRKVPVAQVQTWVATMTTNKLDFSIPPGAASVSFDCTVPEPVDVLILGGHMHEHGARFSLDIGDTTSSLAPFYVVDPWQPSYRDFPPVSLFFTAPHHLAAGSVIRTTCEWDNPGTTPIEFPAEMCTAFGYLAGTDQPFHCNPGGS